MSEFPSFSWLTSVPLYYSLSLSLSLSLYIYIYIYRYIYNSFFYLVKHSFNVWSSLGSTFFPSSFSNSPSKICGITGRPSFMALWFIELCRHCVFLWLKVWGNPALRQLIGISFPTVFAQLVSLSHILVICVIFQTFSLWYLLWYLWSVIFNVTAMILWRIIKWLAFLAIKYFLIEGMTEDEMVGWRHWLNGHEFEQIPGDSEEQGSLVCCSPWGLRVRHNLTAEQ